GSDTAMSMQTTVFVFVMSLCTAGFIFALCLKAPQLFVLGFLGVLFLFSSSTWGQIEVQNTIYARGVGMFYFSLLNLALLVAGVAALVRKLANPGNPYLAAPLGKYFFAFAFLLSGHVLLGLMSGIDIFEILGNNGLINIL